VVELKLDSGVICNGISNGIRGFIFHGDVGIGKTTCAKAVASFPWGRMRISLQEKR